MNNLTVKPLMWGPIFASARPRKTSDHPPISSITSPDRMGRSRSRGGVSQSQRESLNRHRSFTVITIVTIINIIIISLYSLFSDEPLSWHVKKLITLLSRNFFYYM